MNIYYEHEVIETHSTVNNPSTGTEKLESSADTADTADPIFFHFAHVYDLKQRLSMTRVVVLPLFLLF